MPRPRWLRSSRKSWEKIGYLKVAAVTSYRVGTTDDFVDKVKASLNSTVSVPYVDALADWLTTNGLAAKSDLEVPNDIDLRLQYWWAYNNLDKSGWLSREAIPELFSSFPKKAGLLEESFDLTELGHTLVTGFIEDQELAAIEGKLVSTTSPLIVNHQQRLFFLYCMITMDGDFLLPLLMLWLDAFGKSTFGYLDAAKIMPQALDLVAKNFRGSSYTTDDQNEISELERLRDLVTNQNKERIEKQGSGSRREQLCVPRLEWLIDTGVLSREYDREYRFSEAGLVLVKDWAAYYRQALGKYYAEDCVGKLLNEYFFGPVLVFVCGRSERVSSERCMELMREAHKRARSPLGYTLLRTVLLLMHAEQIEKGHCLFIEYEGALHIVESEHVKKPSSVYYTVDRLGSEHQIKFECD